MREITKLVVGAFMDRRSKKLSNTETDGETLWLHNNAIARWKYNIRNNVYALEVSFAGWPTATTRERLNGLPNVHVFQRDHEQYLNGVKLDWDGLRDWHEVLEWHKHEVPAHRGY